MNDQVVMVWRNARGRLCRSEDSFYFILDAARELAAFADVTLMRNGRVIAHYRSS